MTSFSALLPPLLCSVLLTSTALHAQNGFTLRGELRTRAEYRHGYATLPAPDADAAFFISQRSRAVLGYTTDGLSVRLSLQDVRVWGDEPQVKDEPSIGLHEAVADIALTEELGVAIGRQELVYDDHRLLGNLDWVQQARSHDAAVLHYRHDGWKADLGGAYNQKAEALFGTRYAATSYKALTYVWVGTTIGKGRVSLLGIADGLQENDTTDAVAWRFTYGGNGGYTVDSLALSATFYGQSGTDQSGRTIAAWLGSVSAEYSFGSVGVGMGGDLVSGTDASEQKRNTTFNTLYATNHKFYGTMDYFTALPRDTRNGGLLDLYVTLRYTADRFTLRADVHRFSLAADIADPATPDRTVDRGLGTEIDLTAFYKLTDITAVQAGYSHMFATASMEAIKGGSKSERADWVWLSVSVRPTFLH